MSECINNNAKQWNYIQCVSQFLTRIFKDRKDSQKKKLDFLGSDNPPPPLNHFIGQKKNKNLLFLSFFINILLTGIKI